MQRSALVETRPRDTSRLYSGEQGDVCIYILLLIRHRGIESEEIVYNIEPTISYRYGR